MQSLAEAQDQVLAFLKRPDLKLAEVDAAFPPGSGIGPARARRLVESARRNEGIGTADDLRVALGVATSKRLIEFVMEAPLVLPSPPDGGGDPPTKASTNKREGGTTSKTTTRRGLPTLPTTPDDTVQPPPDDEPNGGLTTSAEILQCALASRVAFNPKEFDFNKVVLNDLENIEPTYMRSLKSAILGIEEFVQKSQVAAAADAQGLREDLDASLGFLEESLGRKVRTKSRNAGDAAFKKKGDQFDRDSVPGFKEIKAAIDELKALKGRPNIAVQGLQPLFQRRGSVFVEFVGVRQEDVGRPVLLTLEERVTSRLNASVAKRARVARMVVEGVEIKSRIQNDRDAFFSGDGPSFPCLAKGSASVPMPADGVLRGGLTLFGNYGRLRLTAKFKCAKGSTTQRREELEVKGLSERTVRDLAAAIDKRASDAISLYVDRTTVIRDALSGLNAVIDQLATAPSFFEMIPVIGAFIASVLENFGNLIENLLQSFVSAIEATVVLQKGSWTAIKDGIAKSNLEIAEAFPELGLAGGPEELSAVILR